MTSDSEKQTARYNKIYSRFSYDIDNEKFLCYLKLESNIYLVQVPFEETLSYGRVPLITHNGRAYIISISKVSIEGMEHHKTEACFEWKRVAKWFNHTNRNILTLNGNNKNISSNLGDLVQDIDMNKVTFDEIHPKIYSKPQIVTKD